jgi:ADP-ribosylglycohydrolase
MLPRLLEQCRDRICPLVHAVAEFVEFPLARLVVRMTLEQRSDVEVIGGMRSPACYIDQSFPLVRYLAARYRADFESALVAKTNVGGDNCHGGAVLGPVLGAALGFGAIPPLLLTYQ